MRISVGLPACLAFAALAAPAFAQDAPENGRGGGRQRMGAAPLMQALDADQDGALSPAEIENAAKALAKLDRNGDGTLSTDELRPAQGGPGAAGRPPGQPGSPGRPGQAGGAMTGEMLTRMFETRDADKDGKLTGEEIPERMPRISNASTPTRTVASIRPNCSRRCLAWPKPPVATRVVAPKVAAPKVVAPKVVAPKVVAPKVAAPKVAAPKVAVAGRAVAKAYVRDVLRSNECERFRGN